MLALLKSYRHIRLPRTIPEQWVESPLELLNLYYSFSAIRAAANPSRLLADSTHHIQTSDHNSKQL